jgi:hypothetical protein
MKTLRLKREQALARRGENLNFWYDQLAVAAESAKEELVRKIERAQKDIANLKRKLGVV